MNISQHLAADNAPAESFANRLTHSAQTFRTLVWPAIRELMGGGELVAVESGAQIELDTLAGIDAWQINRADGQMRGIASRVIRVSPVGQSYRSFTIRYELANRMLTEYAKRLRAIEDPAGGWLAPHFTVQAFVCQDHRHLYDAGVVLTRDLFLYTKDALARGAVDIRTNPKDGNKFIAIQWDELRAAGVDVRIVEGTGHMTQPQTQSYQKVQNGTPSPSPTLPKDPGFKWPAFLPATQILSWSKDSENFYRVECLANIDQLALWRVEPNVRTTTPQCVMPWVGRFVRREWVPAMGTIDFDVTGARVNGDHRLGGGMEYLRETPEGKKAGRIRLFLLCGVPEKDYVKLVDQPGSHKVRPLMYRLTQEGIKNAVKAQGLACQVLALERGISKVAEATAEAIHDVRKRYGEETFDRYASTQVHGLSKRALTTPVLGALLYASVIYADAAEELRKRASSGLNLNSPDDPARRLRTALESSTDPAKKRSNEEKRGATLLALQADVQGRKLRQLKWTGAEFKRLIDRQRQAAGWPVPDPNAEDRSVLCMDRSKEKGSSHAE